MVVHKEIINERSSYIFVEWSCVTKGNKSVRTLIFGQMIMHTVKLNERRSYIFVEWSFANERNKSIEDPNFWSNGPSLKKEKINEDLNFWSCANIRNKLT